MSGISRFLGFLTVFVSSYAVVQAAPTATDQPTGFRLTVELKDGSRIVGKSRDEHFQFRSASLGEIKLPLEKVRLVEGVGKTNEAKLVTTSADTLMVEFAMKEIRVETEFGEVKLPVAMIKSLRVSAIGGAGRPTEGLIGLWSGDGNADDSVSGNNGRNENVSFTDGVAGQSCSISPKRGSFGVRVCIDVPDKPAYVLTQALTIEGWIRPRGGGNVIFTRGDRRSGFDPYTLSMDGSHTLVFQITGDAGESADVRADNIPYGEWTHIAGTWDSGTKMMRVYTNGVLAAEKETSIRPDWRIDSKPDAGRRHWQRERWDE